MNSKTFVSAVLAMSLVTGASAFAQGHEDHHDRGRHEQSRGEGQRDRGDNEDRQQDRREERGAGPDQQFHRGDRLPDEYRHRQYVVDDWRGHHLGAPPRGYHWVQSGGDYILIAIASGVIAQILLGH